MTVRSFGIAGVGDGQLYLPSDEHVIHILERGYAVAIVYRDDGHFCLDETRLIDFACELKSRQYNGILLFADGKEYILSRIQRGNFRNFLRRVFNILPEIEPVIILITVFVLVLISSAIFLVLFFMK